MSFLECYGIMMAKDVAAIFSNVTYHVQQVEPGKFSVYLGQVEVTSEINKGQMDEIKRAFSVAQSKARPDERTKFE